MLTLDDLSGKISAYRDGALTLGDFESWFEEISTGAVYDNPDLREAVAAVDAAFAEYHFDHVGQSALKRELEAAVQPFRVSAYPIPA